MKPEASPLLSMATLLGLTTLSAQLFFNQAVERMDLDEAEMSLALWDVRVCLGHRSGDRAASEGAESVSMEVDEQQSRFPVLMHRAQYRPWAMACKPRDCMWIFDHRAYT